jgi:hypothetical protein
MPRDGQWRLNRVNGGGGEKQNTMAAIAAACTLGSAGAGRCSVGLFSMSLGPTGATWGGDPYHGSLKWRGRPENGARW